MVTGLLSCRVAELPRASSHRNSSNGVVPATRQLSNPVTQNQPSNSVTQQPNNPITQQPSNLVTQQPNNPVTHLLILLVFLFATSASAADLRDLKDPGRINDLFPRAAKLRIVNIWATWCVPCVAEMPELRAVEAAFGPEVAIAGVSMDDMIPDARRENVAAFLDRQKIGYVNVYYKGNADDLSRYYRFEGEIPLTIAFDAAGHEVWRHQGAIKSASTISELRKLLRRMP